MCNFCRLNGVKLGAAYLGDHHTSLQRCERDRFPAHVTLKFLAGKIEGIASQILQEGNGTTLKFVD